MESTTESLPPPSSLARHSLSMSTPLPPAPSQWQGSECMKYWLTAKAEEDRRSQEEERTRQESMRLEQRKIEQRIFLESLRAGIPPNMVPFIFTGMNGGSNSKRMLDILQQCMTISPQGSTVQTALNPGVPVALPLISQQSPQATTPPESQSDWQQRMEAYFSGRKAPPKKKKPRNDSLTPAPGGSFDAPVASLPIPQTPQRPAQRESHSRQSPTSIPYLQWLPPYDLHSNVPIDERRTRPPNSPEVSSYTRIRSQTSLNRKRKCQSSQHDGPPSPSCLAYETSQASQLDTQTPNSMMLHNYGPDIPHQPSDAYMSHESQTMDGRTDQAREQAARLDAKPTANTANVSVEREDEERISEQYISNEPQSQSQAVPDAGNGLATTQETEMDSSEKASNAVTMD